MATIAAQLEGIITALPVVDGNGDATFPVLGITVLVRRSAGLRRRIRTPSDQKRLTVAQLADPAPLPGRSQPGFVGCTAIVAGNYDTNTRVLEVAYPATVPAGLPPNPPFEFHPFLEVGPPETLLLGPCTGNAGGQITVNHVAVDILTPTSDPGGRLIPPTPKNEFGIDINVANIQVGDPVSVEGYPSDDGGPPRFIGLVVEVDSTNPNLLANPNLPQIGITRAQGRNRGGLFDLEVRGGIYAGPASAGTPTRQRITIQRLDAGGAVVEGDPNGLLRATAEAPAGGFDTWGADGRLTGTAAFPFAPVGVQATWFNGPPNTVAQEPNVDVRDDPNAPPTATTPP